MKKSDKSKANDNVISVNDGKVGVLATDIGVYTYDVSSGFKMDKIETNAFEEYFQQMPYDVGGIKVIPYGENNLYPDEIRSLIKKSKSVYEVLYKKLNLTWGQGIGLYKTEFVDGVKKKTFYYDADVFKYLDSINYKVLFYKSFMDLIFSNGFFTYFNKNRGNRGNMFTPYFIEIKYVPLAKARFEWNDYQEPVNIIKGDIKMPQLQNLRRYPIMDETDIFKYPVSMSYTSMFTFGQDIGYPDSPVHDLKNWINLTSTVPKLLLNLEINSAAIKYHIQSPEKFWVRKKEKLIIKYKNEGKSDITDEIWEKYVNDYMVEFSKVLSDYMNVGKFIHTMRVFDEDLKETVDWIIKPLDQGMTGFIDDQLKMSKEGEFALNRSLALNPALSNLSTGGNLPSGSELLYAFKLYLLTQTEIPEMFLFMNMNRILASMFPDRGELGFYHDVVVTESQTSPQDRIKNN